MRHEPHGRRGVTLVELLVVLAILGVVGAMSVTAFGGHVAPNGDDTARAALAQARSRALATGQPVRVTVRGDGGAYDATALPDGSVVAEPALRTERLTGQHLREEQE